MSLELNVLTEYLASNWVVHEYTCTLNKLCNYKFKLSRWGGFIACEIRNEPDQRALQWGFQPIWFSFCSQVSSFVDSR